MLSLVPDLQKQFSEFVDGALEGAALSDRDRAIVTLAMALAFQDGTAVKQAVVSAKQAGLSNPEIGQITAMAVALFGQRIANLGLVTNPNNTNSQSTCCR